MSSNPVIATLGRHLRLAVIGGGPGSFIGGMHRMAARIDDRYELVAGVLSSDPERAIARAKEIGLQEGRGYSSVARISIKMLPRQSLPGLPVKRQIRLPCISLLLPMVLLEYFLLML